MFFFMISCNVVRDLFRMLDRVYGNSGQFSLISVRWAAFWLLIGVRVFMLSFQLQLFLARSFSYGE